MIIYHLIRVDTIDVYSTMMVLTNTYMLHIQNIPMHIMRNFMRAHYIQLFKI